MAGLESTIRHARATFADAPVAQRAPQPSPAVTEPIAGSDDIDSDIAARLKSLDCDQLMQVAEALGRHVDGTDEQALRRSIADWVGEWANGAAEDSDDEDPGAARAAGRQEAIGSLEEEIGLLDEPLTCDE